MSNTPIRRIKANRHGYVYRITFTRPTDLKEFYYVGQHLGQEFDSTYTGSGSRLSTLKKKYGVSNLVVDVLAWCFSQEELNRKEIKHISIARETFGSKCLNLMYGGANGRRHPSTIEKISKAKIGNTGRKGIPLTQEHKDKLRASKLGRPLSESHAKAISEGLKGKPKSEGTLAAHVGAKRSEETRAKMRQARLGKKHSPETLEKMRQSAILAHARKSQNC